MLKVYKTFQDSQFPEDSVTSFLTIFFAWKIRPRQKQFRELFRFREYIQSQSSIIHPNCSSDTAVFKFLNYCYWMSKHTQIPFFPDCSKICEKSSTFSKIVCVVIDVSANAHTVSATTCARCQRSQQLRWHAIFENIKFPFFVTFLYFFYFFQSKIISRVSA